MNVSAGSASEFLIGTISQCQICSFQPLEPVMGFGHHPPVDSLLTEEQLNGPEPIYPLNLCRCTECGLVQLDYAVDPRILFYSEYPYRTGITNSLRRSFDTRAAYLVETYGLKRGDLVVDIGSNDGTALQEFRSRGLKVLGVEPTGIAHIAVQNGIPTVNSFFDEEVARKIVAEHGRAAVVTAANVFAHVNNLAPLLRGVNYLLSEGGIFVSESGYLMNLIQDLQYDTIYHEHLRYYSLKPLIELLCRFGFTVSDAERIPNHGGSIRVFAVKSSDHKRSVRLDALLLAEDQAGLYEKSTYEMFRRRVVESKIRLMELVIGIRSRGERIVGVGCPGRGSTVMNYCHIDTDILSYIAEQKESLKVGLFSPGTHVPVVDEQRLFAEQPEYALLLAWHIGADIMPKLRARGLKSRFIIPLPDPKVVA